MIFDREHRAFSGVFVLFGFFTVLFWSVFFRNHLIEREQAQLFLWGTSYLKQHFMLQGGFSVYLGEFFTQFFKIPWLGAFVLSALLLNLALSIRKILRYFSQNPLLDVFAFFPVVGYGIVLYDSNYLVAGVVALTLSLRVVAFLLRFGNRAQALYWGIALLPLVYWLAGGAYLLYGFIWLLALLIQPAGKTTFRSPGMLERLFGLMGMVLLMAAVPLIFRQLFLFDTIGQSYLSEVFYKFRFVFPMPVLYVSVGILAVILLVRLFAQSVAPRKSGYFELAMLVLVSGFSVLGILGNANFSDERELRFSNWVNEQKWDKITESGTEHTNLGPQARVALALALAHEGKLTSQVFDLHLNNDDLFLKYNSKGMVPFLASDVFYHLGLNNFAQMSAMESIETAPDGKWPARAMKRAAENYVVNGQYAVAEKFLLKLKKTLFYRSWANETLELLHNEYTLANHEVWSRQRERMPKADFIFNDADFQVSLEYLLQANMDNRTAYEYLLANLLFKLDFDAFLAHLEFYNHFNYSETPQAIQEAIVYIETLGNELPTYVKAISIDDETRQRLKQFSIRNMPGGSKKPESLKADFGETFWYYLHFKDHE